MSPEKLPNLVASGSNTGAWHNWRRFVCAEYLKEERRGGATLEMKVTVLLKN